MKQQIAWTLMACIAVFTSATTLAERSATGIVKPLQSVQFSPDNDVKCLSSAVEAGEIDAHEPRVFPGADEGEDQLLSRDFGHDLAP